MFKDKCPITDTGKENICLFIFIKIQFIGYDC